MGTTVTSNLALIKPDIDESIKANMPTFAGWAVQNGLNCDTIDALFRMSNTTYALTWTALTTNPVLGAGGLLEGKYIRLWPRMVLVYFRLFTGGAGFTPGSGIYKFNLPVAPSSELSGFNLMYPLGKAVLLDFDTVLTSGNMAVLYDNATNTVVLRTTAGAFFAPTAPITLAQNDRVSGYMMYPTSAP